MPASNKFAKDILLDCFMLDSRLYSIKKYKLFMSYFINILKEAVKPYHLLQHPFYQKWNKGVLNKKVLQNILNNTSIMLKLFLDASALFIQIAPN